MLRHGFGFQLAVLCFALIDRCGGQALVRTTYVPNAAPSSNVSAPNWSNGMFVQWTHSQGPGDRPKVWAYNKQGQQVIPVSEVWFPDTASARVHAAVATPDGVVVASVLTWSTSGQMATLLCFLGPTGITSVARTNQFVAQHLGYSPDGALWAFGYRPASSPTDTGGDNRTLRRFSAKGVQLSESVRSAVLANSATKGIRASQISGKNGGSFLLVGSSRKFLFNSGTRSFVELDNNGKVLRSATLNMPLDSVTQSQKRLVSAVITQTTGRLFCWLSGGEGVWQLNPDTLSWTLIDKSQFGGQYGGIFGVEGELAIMQSAGNNYGWFNVPSQ